MKERKLFFMEWSECKASFLRKAEVDKERIASTIKLAMQRLVFVQSLKATEENVPFIVED
ncbi:hypothetical protein HYT51_01380, partial [Candidatus Woesearchaeota archaeon]|nr:hypothetical protein [Candidatus Woesearchaeota archaeon]